MCLTRKTGKTIFLSGHIAKKDGKVWVGKLGQDMSTEEGKHTPGVVAIDLLGTLAVAATGLDNVVRIVKVMSLVNSTRNSPNTHLVTNGCSELLGEVFEWAWHARSAFGVAQIPLGACVKSN